MGFGTGRPVGAQAKIGLVPLLPEPFGRQPQKLIGAALTQLLRCDLNLRRLPPCAPRGCPSP